jgi:hypothetical protein
MIKYNLYVMCVLIMKQIIIINVCYVLVCGIMESPLLGYFCQAMFFFTPPLFCDVAKNGNHA